MYRPALFIEEQPAAEGIHWGEPHPAILGSSNHQNHAAVKPLRISKIYKIWDNSERSCIHVDIDLRRSTKYKSGDYIAIWPSNSNEQVNRLLSALEMGDRYHYAISINQVDKAGAGKVTIPTPTTVDILLRYYLEIAAPVSPETVADMTHFISDESARANLRRISAYLALFQTEITIPCLTLADVLYKVSPQGGWKLPLSFLLERLQYMLPRLYSIASSPMVHPQEISVCPVTDGGHGIATNYIHAQWAEANPEVARKATHELDGPGKVLKGGKIFGQVQHSTFKLPVRGSIPIVMVGAGTGVTPFRRFLQELVRCGELGQQVGRTLLFKG